jgi:RNA polymerase sigma-70 factor (ECF subfamily)
LVAQDRRDAPVHQGFDVPPDNFSQICVLGFTGTKDNPRRHAELCNMAGGQYVSEYLIHSCRASGRVVPGLFVSAGHGSYLRSRIGLSAVLPLAWSPPPGRLGMVVAMGSERPTTPPPVALATLDAESAEWVRALSRGGAERERAATRLHEILLRIAWAEVHRRSGRRGIAGPEADDLAHQAAADALVAIIGKVGQFRGESRFTTWAYKFVIFEVSAKIGRHFWLAAPVSLDAEDWARLPDRFGFDPAQQAQWQDLLAALRCAVEQELTARQRRVFVAIVLNAIPLDTLVVELDSNRNAIYKTLFDARRKLRAILADNGYLDHDTPGLP